MSEPTGNEIAIIGMAGTFPGAPDLATFWRNLRAGVESISFFDEPEPSPLVPGQASLPGFVPAGGVLDGADLFDHDLFGISPRESRWMDPQQRVFLQLAWAALEDAGYDPARFAGRISVYAGAGNSGHLLAVLGQAGADPASLYEAIGGASADNLATKVSFLLRLRGESMNVHTACSTGLATVHMACQSLLLGQSQLALAGAVSITVPQRTGYVHQDGMILSPDGHCRAFDHRAGGTVPGHGAGVVVLKPLSDALADRDPVHAVILGSAINNEGHRSVGYTAPSVDAQAEVVAEALAFAGVTANDIGYVEAHGTGTPLGDPIEITALTRAFRRSTERVADCPLGSVKTNVGHLDTAAGIAGLVKVALMLRHGEIPPSLHFERPNPAIDFDSSPFAVNTALRPWGDRRVAGVSSFGIGGTNVHAVLAAAPADTADTGNTAAPADDHAARPECVDDRHAPSARPHQLVTLSAHTPTALRAMSLDLAESLDLADRLAADLEPDRPCLAPADVAFTRAVGRAELRCRRTLVVGDLAELVAGLREGDAHHDVADGEPRVGLLFPGQGSAYLGMAAEVSAAEPAFKAELDECVGELQRWLRHPLGPVMHEGDGGPVEDVELAHAALFAMEYALARLWLRWGVRPAALLGHSFGEYAAACVAGVLTLADAAELAVLRGRLMAGLPEGAMLSVGLDEQAVERYLGSELALAAVNGDERCVVSGPVPAIAELRERLRAEGHATVQLPVRRAFHSAAVEPVYEELAAAFEGRALAAPSLPLVSSVTGAWWQVGGADYWVRQVRAPVRFAEGVATLADLGDPADLGDTVQPDGQGEALVLIEVGPGSALTSLARSQLRERARPVTAVPSMRRRAGKGSDHRALLSALGTLWRRGAPIDWTAFYAGERRRRVPVPTYPFEGTDCRLPAPIRPPPQTPIDGAIDLSYEKIGATPAAASQEPEPATARPDGPRDELERRVFAIWVERLGTDDFGIHDDFLELGGNSLIAAQLITRLRSAFSTPLPLSALFEAPTVAGTVERLRAAGGAGASTMDGSAGGADGSADDNADAAADRGSASRATDVLPPIRPRPEQAAPPLSVVQARTLALEAADPGNPGLVMPMAIELAGRLDRGALASAVTGVVRRHESLRTTFHRSETGWQQRIGPAGSVPDVTLDLEDVPDEETAQQVACAEPERVFDLTVSPLRVRLLRLAPERHLLLATLHHVVSDTLSMVNFMREVAAGYAAAVDGQLPELPPLPVQYADFGAWQRDLLRTGALRRQREYWRERLADLPPPLALPTDRPRGTEHGIRSGQLTLSLPRELSGRVAELGQRLGATLFSTLLAGYAALLSRVTGAGDIVVGTPIGNRDHAELEPVIGYVAHSVPLRVDTSDDPSFAELVGRSQRTLLSAYAHPDLPYEELVAELDPDRDTDRSRIFDAMFVLHSGIPQELPLPGMTWRLWEVPDMPAMFGATLATLSLMLAESPDGLTGTLEYAQELLDQESARRLTDQFVTLVAGAVERPEVRLSELVVEPAPAQHPAEQPAQPGDRRDVRHWPERLRAAAGADPDGVALTGPDATFTWSELVTATRGGEPVRLGTTPSAQRLMDLVAAWRASQPVILPDAEAPAGPVAASVAFVEPSGMAWTHDEVCAYLDGLDRNVVAGPGAVLAAEEPLTVRAALDLLWALCTGRPVRVPAGLAAVPAWVPPQRRNAAPLQFSLSYFADDEDSLEGAKYRLLLDGVRLADELGLAAVWTPERHFHSFGGLYPSPTATSAALAAATSRIGIRAGSVVLPLHDPIRVAEDWAVIDNVSGGRVGVSFASGWHPDDFVLAPDRFGQRRELMREGIDVVRALWRGETVRRGNGVGAEVDVAIRPRPVQPELPFWLTAASSPETFRLAGELGGYVLTNLMAQSFDELASNIAVYRQAWREAGHASQGHVTLMLHTFLADDTADAFAQVREPLLRYFRSSVGIAKGFLIGQGLDIRPEDLSEADLRSLIEHGLDRYLHDGGLFGTPDSCAGVVERVRELDVDEIAALIDYGVPLAPTLRSIELLGELAGRERDRAEAAAATASRDTEHEVAALAASLASTQIPVDTIQATPSLLHWLHEVAPEALERRTLLAGSPATTDPAATGPAATGPAATGPIDLGHPVSVRASAVTGMARAQYRDGELRCRPGEGAQVLDVHGRPVGTGVVGELHVRAAATGQRARWRADGGLDLLPPAPAPRRAPLSFAQQRLWYLDQLVPGNVAYNNTVALRMAGDLDRSALHRALQEVVRRHEVLRTTIDTTGNTSSTAVQVVHPAVELALPVRDALPGDVDERAREFARIPFDLASGPLLRACLLRVADREHVLLIGMHHIVSDGWSAGVLLGELAALYAAFSAGEPSPLPPLSLQYTDFARQQRERQDGQDGLDGQDGEEAEGTARELAYWTETLAGVPMLELPLDRPRAAVQGQRGAREPVVVDPALTERLHRLCRDTGVTTYMALHAALVTLLHRYSGQTDLAIGTAVAGRNQPETEQLVGCFINTVVVRADLTGDPTFRELLGRVKDATLGAVAHQEIPFERLVDELNVPRALSHAPLVQAMFVLHNTPSPQVRLGGLTLSAIEIDSGTAKLDLVLELREQDGEIAGAWEFNTDVFDRDTMRRLSADLLGLLGQATADADRRLSGLCQADGPERDRVLALSTGPALPSDAEPRAATVVAAFEAQADRTPAAPAAAAGSVDGSVNGSVNGDAVTFAELDERANAIAHGLRERGVRSGGRVAVPVDRPVEAITAMLGVLKAGAAYVPLDPSAPPARRRALVERAGAHEVSDWAEVAAGQPSTRPQQVNEPTDPAYVIFTSGSTGRPKGVVVEHGQLLWSTRARRAHYGEPGRCLNLYALTFDGSVAWIWFALLTGGTVWCPPHDVVGEPRRLAELVAEQGLTRVATVPALYGQLLAAADAGQLASLRSVTVGGEACPAELVRAHAGALPGAELHNEYGPTEATVWSTVHRIGPAGDRTSTSPVPIGRPIPGARNYVLGEHGVLLPAGAAGELYVGGPAVARGYLDEPEQTRERFRPDPFGGNGDRVYRTGDRARWNRRGELEFLGRTDRQLKVRGFRVEPAEIEAVLTAHPAVAEAAVTTNGSAHRLVGYLAPAGDATVDPDELTAFARSRLPDYLVPARLVTLPALPRTRHGKLDVRALPAIDQPTATAEPVAPRSELERTLATIVAETLRLDSVGVHDDFFDLGGDSILAMSVVNRARQHGVSLTVRQLFETATVAGLASTAGRNGAPAPPLASHDGTSAGTIPLAPIQRWFFEQDLPQPAHFNLSVQLELALRPRPEVLQDAMRAVLDHHPALRLRFERHADGWRQRYGEPGTAWTLETAISPVDLTALDQRLQESLDLAEGPLLRAALVRRGPDLADRLLLVAHHLVVDAVSWRIVLADLFTAYRQLLAGRPVELPAMPATYAQWARGVAGFTADQAELDFWTGQPYDLAPRLPRDGDGPNLHSASNIVRVELDAEQTRAVLGGALGAEPHAAIIGAVGAALAGWTGAGHVQLDVERHGREDLVPGLDVSRTVGWFSDFHPVVLTVPQSGVLGAVAGRLRRVPRRGAGFVALRFGPGESPLRSVPPSEVAVNYLGQLDLALPPDAPAHVVGDVLGSLRGPDGTRPYLLEITAGVLSGRLWLVWTYTEGIHDRGTVERLAGRAAELLRSPF